MKLMVTLFCVTVLLGCGGEADRPEPARRETPEAAGEEERAEAPRAETPEPARETVPTSAPETATPSAAPGETGLAVVEGTFTHGVEGRAPIDRPTEFAVGDRVTYHLIVRNDAGPSEVTVEWLRGGGVVGRLPLKVGSSRAWRTWAYRRVTDRDAAGIEVRVVDPDGNVIHTDRAAVRPAAG